MKKNKNYKGVFIWGLLAITILLVVTGLYFSFTNSVEKLLSKESKNNSELISALRSDYIFSGILILLGSFSLLFLLCKALFENFKKGRLNHELNDLKLAFDETAIVARTDLKGKITHVNDKFCTISKYSKDELLGKDHRLLNSGYHSKEFFKEMWGTIKRGKVWRGVIRNKAKDGSIYWVDSTLIPIRNSEGIVHQYVAIRFDITEQKEGEEQIREHNKDLENFAHIVSHDLKAPLRGINTLADFIEDDLGNDIDEEVKNNLTLLKGRIKRMNNLITGVMNFSKHSLNVDSETMDVDLNDLIAEILEDADFKSGVKVNTSHSLPPVTWNRIKLKIVFSNLIWNAVKYNDKLIPEISIGFENQGNKTVYFVKDNGPGIEEDFQEKVFVIFQTLNKRDDVESTGVGLSIVKKIIEKQGGEIWIDSDGENGTTFYFTFE